jgi:hypothetical protein
MQTRRAPNGPSVVGSLVNPELRAHAAEFLALIYDIASQGDQERSTRVMGEDDLHDAA